ncbi:MAG: 50S ribosomal protein L18 [Nitrospiraceae bacterium]|nr:50S ribosomal protein L18 [Nitrospiraceae bacterium]
MTNKSHKAVLLARRKRRIRKQIAGTPECPRVSVSRSLKQISAQVIDDTTGRTLAAVSSLGLKVPGGNIEGAKQVGKALAEAAVAKGVTTVCFDRNGRLFHGRVKALADAAREAGLKF